MILVIAIYVIIAIGFFIRSVLVDKFRLSIFNKSIKEYEVLPSHDYMVFKFWIPINKFARKERMLSKLDD